MVSSKDPNNILELNPNYLKNLQNLQIIQFIHKIIRLVQLAFLIKDMKNRARPIDGNTVIRVYFFTILTQAFNVSTSMLREKYSEHISISNTFFRIPIVKSNFLIKLIYFNAPIFAILAPMFYALALICIDFDPITLYVSIAYKEWSTFNIFVKIIMVLFETFSMTLSCILCTQSFYQDMFCWYIAL